MRLGLPVGDRATGAGRVDPHLPSSSPSLASVAEATATCPDLGPAD